MSENTKVQLWTRDFVLITLTNLMLFISFQMLMPTLPIYAEKLGGGELAAGLIIGVFTISSVVIRPYVGLLMDRQGRKGIFTVGLGLFVLAAFLYNFTYSIVLLLALRIIHGFSWGAATTASGTVAADVIPSARRGEGLGYYGMSANLAMAFAPALGLFIIGSYEFSHLFVVATAIALIALISSQAITYAPVEQKKEEAKPAIFEKSSFAPSSVLFFLTFIYGGVVTFIALYAKSLGIDNIGIFFTVYAIFLLFTRPMAGKLADKKGTDFVVIPGMLMTVGGVIILGLANHFNHFMVSAIFLGVGFGAVQPSLQALTISLAPVTRRGAANATFFSAFDMGIGVGSVFLGLLSTWIGYAHMYLFSGLVGLVGLIIYIKLIYNKNK